MSEVDDNIFNGANETEITEEYCRERNRIEQRQRWLNRRLNERRTRWIPLKHEIYQGLKAAVDAHLYDRLVQFQWHAFKGSRAFYPYRSVERNGRRRRLSLCRAVVELIIDHKTTDRVGVRTIDGRGLDCRAENIEACDADWVKVTGDLEPHDPPKYHNVCWNEHHKKWRVGDNYPYKYFDTQLDAAIHVGKRWGLQWGEFFPGLKISE